ncbi:caspase family protein [Kribbella speibonae]|uniref:Caspase family protein n=2 Tax=Kribbella speibonae TaxID=1572660 RepID=A0ABY2A2J2_9ACTN|nr:caspase family protein [Kribbella speibonae]
MCDMPGARIALVVANDHYDDPGLRSLVAPAQDAAALAEALADPSVGGFEVQVLRNESAQGIRVAVEDFFADRQPEDLLLLHFSCHGLKNAAGELFLAVADTKPARLASTAVAADFVNRQMSDSRAQRIALFLDCCYGGAFPRGMVVRAAGEAQVRDAFAGQADVGGGRGRVVVTASSAMEYAFEGGQLATDATPAPSVFTGAVVDGLTTGEADRDGDGWVGLTELVGYVTDRVRRVTPNQNPQMWTFGSQGELLIARSRIRRITPAPLAPELTEAMESPLPAARFGVVDYLRERLSDADLGQAYAAWQALHRMIDDDSRRVSDAVAEAIAGAELVVTPPDVELTGETAELRLEGPPIALTASASASVSWLKVEQDGAIVRVRADGAGDASVILSGPIGERRIPVRATLPDTESEPPAPPPEPEPEPVPRPAPLPEPPQTEPPQVERLQTEPAQTGPVPELSVESVRPPWWLIGVLIVGSGLLIGINWPGAAESSNLWYDPETTGWHVYRSWHDPVFLSSVTALVVSLISRWAGPVALGVVAGAVAGVLEDALLILGAGIWENDTETPWSWLAVLGIGLVMAAVLLVVLWPERWRIRPVPVPGAVLVVAGGILVLASGLINHPDGFAFVEVTVLAVLEPLVVVALAWLALAAVEARALTWLAATATTYAVISAIAAIPALTGGDAPVAFLAALLGSAAIVAGVLSRVLRLPSRP